MLYLNKLFSVLLFLNRIFWLVFMWPILILTHLTLFIFLNIVSFLQRFKFCYKLKRKDFWLPVGKGYEKGSYQMFYRTPKEFLQYKIYRHYTKYK